VNKTFKPGRLYWAVQKSLPISAGQSIASRGHFLMMLGIQFALVLLGFWMQRAPASSPVALPGTNVARRIWPFYLSIIALEWGLVATVRGAMNDRGFRLRDLVNGGSLPTMKNLLIDAAVSVPFFFAWQYTARLASQLLGPNRARSVAGLLPQEQNALEAVLWIVVSISAGICEEIVFRGYFQHQFAAYTRSTAAAIVLQGLVFGLGHSYQGAKQVALICVLGVLYGAFAAWRKNLRSNMMIHAWTDVWNGWLSRLAA
jgi:uncharacterized protein